MQWINPGWTAFCKNDCGDGDLFALLVICIADLVWFDCMCLRVRVCVIMCVCVYGIGGILKSVIPILWIQFEGRSQ